MSLEALTNCIKNNIFIFQSLVYNMDEIIFNKKTEIKNQIYKIVKIDESISKLDENHEKICELKKEKLDEEKNLTILNLSIRDLLKKLEIKETDLQNQTLNYDFLLSLSGL